jgi:hypothetical protein
VTDDGLMLRVGVEERPGVEQAVMSCDSFSGVNFKYLVRLASGSWSSLALPIP